MAQPSEQAKWAMARAVLTRLPAALGPTLWARKIAWTLDPQAAPAGPTVLERQALLLPDPSDRLQREAMLTGRWDSQAARLLASSLPEGGTMFDVGANVGLASLSVGARCNGRRVTIHAFEPSTANLAHLRRNAAANDWLDLRINPSAVGAAAGEVQLVHGAESGHHHVDARGSAAGETVHMIALDDYASQQRIDIVHALKIDVEGYELEVLRGAARLLTEKRVQMILCEVEDDHLRRAGTSARQLVGELLAYGLVPFQLAAVRTRVRDVIDYRPARLSGDIAFIPVDRVT
jgi:FkbM family methyltransferase